MSRGVYTCVGWGVDPHEVPASLPPKPGNKRRINNSIVDHVVPVVPTEGFDSWDGVIERLFCEQDGLQLLCDECHSRKTQEEREERKDK